MRINDELLEQGRSDAGGWNREQLAAIGIRWPLMRGWKDRAKGREITEKQAKTFLALRGKSQGVKS